MIQDIEVPSCNKKSTEKTGPNFEYPDFKDKEYSLVEDEKAVVEVFHNVLQLYKPKDLLLSFNGGKDCTVVLHMLHRFYQKNALLNGFKITTLYVTDPNAFEEIDQFVDSCEKLYAIRLIKRKGPIKEALKELCKEYPNLKAVFMGSRRNDPFCKDLKVMQITDPDWPPLMRINPIIDWKCRQVWEYIFHYNVPYCILYKKGYTSIGNKKNTRPNPHLRLIDMKTGGVSDYRHGYELMNNDELERAGRF